MAPAVAREARAGLERGRRVVVVTPGVGMVSFEAPVVAFAPVAVVIVATAFLTRLDAVTSVAWRQARRLQVQKPREEARQQAPRETLRGHKPA